MIVNDVSYTFFPNYFFFRETNRRFQIAAEVRDNLVAAANNLTSAHQSLHGVKVPYCTSEEIETLTKVYSVFSYVNMIMTMLSNASALSLSLEGDCLHFYRHDNTRTSRTRSSMLSINLSSFEDIASMD